LLDPESVVPRLRAAGCVFAEEEARLLVEAAATPDELDAMVKRRVDGLPLEYVLGWAEFAGRRFVVEPGVFVPRHRTELLARLATGFARPGAVVVDLCCGSGALGAVVAAAVPVELHATDIEPAAVRCARRNVAGHVYQGDLYTPLPSELRGRVEVLISNVPYVPTGEIALLPPEAREHEPRVALDGGADGLDVLRRVVTQAPAWLAPGGHVLFETSEAQAARAVADVERAGLRARVEESEELGATVVVGQRVNPLLHKE
jgi:release factor glutamine methyltransferase